MKRYLLPVTAAMVLLGLTACEELLNRIISLVVDEPTDISYKIEATIDSTENDKDADINLYLCTVEGEEGYYLYHVYRADDTDYDHGDASINYTKRALEFNSDNYFGSYSIYTSSGSFDEGQTYAIKGDQTGTIEINKMREISRGECQSHL